MKFGSIRNGKILAVLIMLIMPSLASAAATGSFDVETATRLYLDTLQGAELEKSNSYFEGGYWLILWGAVVGFLADFFLLQSRLSSRFRDWAERVTNRIWLVPALTALPYVSASFLLTLPWVIYTRFFREKQYDLMSQSFGEWFGETAIEALISFIIFPLLIAAIYAAIRWSPKRWWLWGTGVAAFFIGSLMLAGPVFISPMFNEYTEMEQGPLRDKLVAMAAKYDVPADNIYVFDQSKQHKRISANVSGIGPTIRISLNDNLLERTSEPEILAVMGHELGHYVRGHIWVLMAGMLSILALGLFVVSRLAPLLIARYEDKWGVREMADPASLPLISLMLTLYFFAVTPVFNTIVRVNEVNADAFSLDAAREPDGHARVDMRLSEYRKIEPGPIEEFVFFDHPSGANRVRMAMEWKAKNVENPVMVKPEPSEQE